MSGPADTGWPAVGRPHRETATTARRWSLGSIAGKTMRDSRPGMLGIGGLLAAMVLVGGWTMLNTYGTPEARAELAAMSTDLPPVMRGLYGNPVRVDTLGGFLSWHYGAYFALLGGLWSILSLSSTLAGEAHSGSLDLVLATQLGRRTIAAQKVVAHVAALGVVGLAVALAAWAAGALLGRYDGDAISPAAAAGFAAGILIRSLAAGSVAFALAPIVGRGASAGIAGAVMFGGYVTYSYRTVVDALDALAWLTWFSWAAGHVPLAGSWDWPALGLTAVACATLIVVGVEAFARRDVGVTVALPLPGLPRALKGLRGPLGRTLGDLLPMSIAWGVGLGLYGIVMSGASGAMAEILDESPGLKAAISGYIPGMDLSTAAGFLQFAFVDLGLVVIGLAAASLVASRCGDETAGRLELQLATPLTRARWALASSAAMGLAAAVITLPLAGSVAIGVVSVGEDPTGPAIGTGVLALYAWAMTGIGVAVAGVAGPRRATSVVVVTTVLTSLVDLLAPGLGLPDWVEQLALTHHMGQPILGTWDATGIAACLGLAIGGALVGAWGMSRRDVAR